MGSGHLTCWDGTSPPRPRTAARVADFTYVAAWCGIVYVAFVVDIYSRAIVGWSAATHKRAKLVPDALQMALWRRPWPGVPPGQAWSITAMPGTSTPVSRSPPTCSKQGSTHRSAPSAMRWTTP